MKWLNDRALNQLTTAINLGETEKALTLIKPGMPLDAVAKGQHSAPVFAAIEVADTRVLEALLQAGASLTTTNDMGETPIHAAAAKGDAGLVRVLIARGASVNAPIVRKGHQYHGRTPLMDAAASNNLATVKLLLEHGADPFAKDSTGMTALAFAEIFGKRVANHLKKVMGASPTASDLGIHDAARAGLFERVQALLASGTLVDARDDLGRSPLYYAVMGGHVDIVRMLLERGAAADLRDKRDFSPLMLADDKPDIARLLLASGADPNADVGGGMTAFHVLARSASAEVLTLLIDAGASLHAKSGEGKVALDYAKSNRPPARRLLKQRMGLASDAIDLLHEEVKGLSRLAKQPAFEAAAVRLGERLNRQPAPWRRRRGVVYFHDVAIFKHLAPGEAAGRTDDIDRLFDVLARLQDEVRAQGLTLVYVNSIPENGRLPLILLPTPNKYAALLVCGTNGINQGHDTEAVISWLMAMESGNPFTLAGCGHDFLDGRFVRPVKNAEQLAERMIVFCPDMVDQAGGSLSRLSRPDQITALARLLSESGSFSFWWD